MSKYTYITILANVADISRSLLIAIMITIAITIFSSFNVFAGSNGKTAKTNINEVTSFFKENIEGKANLESMLEQSKQDAIGGGKSSETLAIFNTDEGEVLTESKKIDKINANDLEAKGFDERYSEKNAFLDLLYIDHSDSKIQKHKKDTDSIADASEKLMHRLKEGLQAIGVDCKSVKGNKEIAPEFFIDIQKKEEKDTIYNKKICEESRNVYNCTNTLSVHCRDPSYVAGTLTNVQGNMTHTITADGLLTIGVNSNRYFYNSWGSQNDYYFTFNVDNPKGIEKFQLLAVSWSDHVLIKLNNHKIFGSSGVQNKLEMSTNSVHYRRGRDGERYYGVNRGDGDYVPSNTKQYFDANPNAEAKQYLKQGQNTLHIRLVYGKGGKIWTRLKYQEKRCSSWQEVWEERCVLK